MSSWLMGEASIGDVQAAFLYFEQPARGLPGVEKGALIEMRKGVFGLSTSPGLWYEKLAKEVKALQIKFETDVITVEESLIDPCVFILVRNDRGTCQNLEAHVDDLMLWTEADYQGEIQSALSSMFPISEWEQENFTYVGNEYLAVEEGYLVKQEEYANNRLRPLDILKGANNSDIAGPDLIADHRTAV